MSVQPNMRYAGTVDRGARMITSKVKGTLGFEIPLSCDDGEITHTLWITSSTREKVLKTFREVLGVSQEQLSNERFVTVELEEYIAGKAVEFTTKEEEYNGEYHTKVEWLNAPSSGGGMDMGDPAKLAAAFFAGKSTPKPKPAQDFPQQRTISDDDVPF